MKKCIFIAVSLILGCLCFLYINYLNKDTPKQKTEKLLSVTDMLNDSLSKHHKYKKDTYILFDCLFDKNVEQIDAYSLFLHMKKRKLKAYYVLLKDTELYKKLEKENNLENIIAIKNYSKSDGREFIYKISDILPKTKVIITSFGLGNAIDYYFKQIPYLKYIFIQHGQVFFKESVLNNGYISPRTFDKVLVSSGIETNIFKKYGWSDNRLLKSALPRWDLLNDNTYPNEKSIMIMFTWRSTTPKRFSQSLYWKRLVLLLENKEFNNFIQNNNIKVYFAPHHAFEEKSNISISINLPNIKFINSLEISEYIKKSSMLLTDLSSVAFDFMFQNKPVIFYGLDRGDPLLEVNQYIDLELLKQKENIFPNIFFNEDDVVNKIKYYADRNFVLEKDVADIYDKFFFIKQDIREDLINQLEHML